MIIFNYLLIHKLISRGNTDETQTHARTKLGGPLP